MSIIKGAGTQKTLDKNCIRKSCVGKSRFEEGFLHVSILFRMIIIRGKRSFGANSCEVDEKCFGSKMANVYMRKGAPSFLLHLL